MVKNLRKSGKIGIAALLGVAIVLAMSGLYLLVRPAEALALSSRKDTLQDSRHGQLSRHTFVFTTATALSTDSGAGADFSVVLNFPTDAGEGDPYGTSVPNFVAANMGFSCTGGDCASHTFTVTDVEESNNGGSAANDEFLVAVSSNVTGDLDLGAVVTLTFGASSGAQRLTNPADNVGCTDGATSADADICTITVATSEAITGTTPAAVDSGNVLTAHISGVAVSVTVAESLTFQINSETNANCDTQFSALGGPDTSSSAVNFGTISSTDTLLHACQFLKVATNASGGYVVTAEEDTSLNRTGTGDLTVDDAICDAGTPCDFDTEGAWITVTRNGFGYSCKTKSGTSVCNFTTETTNYKAFACQSSTAADCDPTDGPLAKQNVMSDGGAVSDDQAYIEYKLSVGATQPSGTYDNSITYIATPTF
ncbi:MAG: hypothetical protein A2806_02510 [Candidatus Terrybacteria bacterium RIFCSPHIGHO2_01_FULL_48_17]|uniref:Uncharacterized protein n=1 Tax=Candidatus Terrybacteria bacterium RIFCSPHIGHO2_01_FULL_48_17 TaxID=1802362 RepID=A0A1G2PHX5_9BACT|nr:MAG: hypothetical protein A2806_02510 [Candidatus Terrybacteria bacterium RIFCSPHIGHO2_01_FULL_48_17]OHA51859.1 MAG: hypothetical protein A3A30_01560 [Candidatus Terrybacteria bacterium RIFCSPLOWO2_01_FULL_48_14]